ncbi:uncharacterized protein LOC114538071 [Dendronephthya gigantea]|uniref:uncharacterized protein LOC114538071 n=1 Tax=Dendronephthya gigantea TaxID=151771 RepID=UPI001069F1CE|nr:uncharacterized protein LOC114538071 [Dendronephthya gigantea]
MRISPLELYNTDVVKNSQYKHAPKPSGFTTWKDYWKYYSGEEWPEKCRFRGCGKNTDGSAHVIINDDEATDYIIPMCRYHLSPGFTENFSVNYGTIAVPIESIDELPLDAGIRVKNVPNTGNSSPPEGFRSWKQFYKKYRRRRSWPSTCRIEDCYEHAAGGAHVYVEDTNRVYILPMCGTHNTAHVTDWFPVKEDSMALRDVTRPDLEKVVRRPKPEPIRQPAPAFVPAPARVSPAPAHVPPAPKSSSHNVTIYDSKPVSKKRNRCMCIIV